MLRDSLSLKRTKTCWCSLVPRKTWFFIPLVENLGGWVAHCHLRNGWI